MNNGKICVSVCAETAEDLIKQIKRAEDLADVIEIRFDCLNESEFDSALQKVSELNCKKSFLATFRPKNEHADLTPALRIYKNNEEKELHRINAKHRFNCWERILDIKNIKYVDFEYDIHSLLHWNMNFVNFWNTKFEAKKERQLAAKLENKKLIFSEHFFLRGKIDLEETYDRLAPNTDDSYEKDDVKELRYIIPSIIKIAARTDDITDTISMWKLLERAKSENNQIIPIAMGESGKWTRILGLAHGAFMTYAALDSGKETAPGQVSVADLIDVYRVKNLNEQTEVYGIIAGNTSYSMSPFMHNAAFKFHDLNAVFMPLQMQNLDEFIKRMVREDSREIELNFKGFSVTNPHKQSIIKHLDFIDETAKKIGAVNTVKIIDGKLHGYNTDAHGFIAPLLNSYGDLTNAKVAVFGAGGAARACIYALKTSGADVTIFARDLEKAKILAEEFQITDYKLHNPKTKDQKPKPDFNDFDIIVNTTPLGTKGELENESIVRAEQIEKVNLVYDLVYNPFQTKLMSEADNANVPKIGGMAMLIAQAMEQQKIWIGLDAPMKEMSAEVLKRLS